MRRTAVGFAILGLALSGCTEDETQQSAVEAQAQANSGSADLYYAYPTQGQASTPTSASVFLRFGERLDASATEIAESDALALREQGSDGGSVDVTNVELLDNGRGLRAEPASELTPGRSYELSISGLSVDGELINESIEFSTAASDSGPIVERTDLTGSTSDFSVARILPYADNANTAVGNGTDEFPVTDLSTFRIQFNEPVDENTLEYGDTVRLMDSEGDLVSAEMFARDHRITVDPNDNLEAGETYELNLGNGIQSQIGGTELTTPDEPWTFTPESTTSPNGERSIMAQSASTDAGKLALTGQDYNSVRLSATTLGDAEDNQTVQTGTVFAEMAYIPRFDQAGKSVPLRIDRGTLMEGSSVEVKVGGEVPSGFGSETIDVRFLSDANGYLMPNPYTSDPSAPRLVRLFLDLGMNTGEPRANGALAQELLHVELVGTAMVEDGTLTLEAVSVIEPKVLGVDKASGLISFRLEDDPDASDQSSFADTTAPSLKSWAPGQEHQDKLQPQDSVTLFFNEPLLPSTVNKNTVWLDQEGNRLDSDQYEVRQNGANVIVEPKAPLSYGQEYKVGLDIDALTDLAGNELGGVGQDLSFSLPETDTENLVDSAPAQVGPLVLTARPGYPCAKADLDRREDKNGRCSGGVTHTTPDSEYFNPGKDEYLPIEKHGSNEPIIVRFSQNMNTDSIDKESFTISKRSESGWEKLSKDAFVLEKGLREVRAVPMDNWEIGATYRYSLTDSIESQSGLPLYTEILQQHPDNDPDRGIETDMSVRKEVLTQGGPDMINRFQVEASDESVLTPLGNLPTLDANSDLELGPDEESGAPQETVASGGSVADILDAIDIPANSASMMIDEVSSGVVGDAAIGCPVGEACDISKKMIFKTAKLDVNVGSEPVTLPNSNQTAVPVKLHPSVLHTSSSDVWIQLDSELLAGLATGDGEDDQLVPTGPMVMRMRYQKDSEGEFSEFIDGYIYEDTESGELRFRTQLNVYLDAPFLLSYLESSAVTTSLEDNMRSFEINDLALDGPIKFFDDGRMQIEQRNVEAIPLNVQLRGESEVSLFGDTEEGCQWWDLVCHAGTAIVNEVVDVNTDLTMTIPKNALHLNYITPYTQKEE